MIFGLLLAEKLRPRQIIPGGHDLVGRVGVGEVAVLVNQHEPSHRRYSLSTTRTASDALAINAGI